MLIFSFFLFLRPIFPDIMKFGGGALARSGKVRFSTPKKEPNCNRPKAKTGRARKRALYNRRFAGKTEDKGKSPVQDFLSPAQTCLLYEKNRGKWWLL